MENAVKELVKTGSIVKKFAKREKSVTKIDYRIIFCGAAAFLVGGAAVFGVVNPKSVAFFSLAMIIILSTYLFCKALIAWEARKITSFDEAKQILMGGKTAFENLSNTYSRDICKKEVVSADEMKELFKVLNDEVCNRCSLKKNCWDIYTGRTEQYIRSLLGYAEKGMDAMMGNADRKNGFSCENRLAMIIYTKNIWRQMAMEYKWKKKLESSKDALAAEFEGTAEIFSKALASVGATPLDLGKNALEKVEIGIAKYAKDGKICGDNCSGNRLNDDKYLFLLSDGMGSGKKAAGESLLTVNTLYQFIKAGFSVEYAMTALNSILVLKSEEDIFATVDVASLNMKNGLVSFYKAGSADAFIRRNGMVETIKRGSLPMGIVDKVKAENVVRRLKPSDMVIMVSDGITDAGKKDINSGVENIDFCWVEESLMEIKSKDPQTVADLLMSKAIARYGVGEKDDMSIIAFAVR